MVLLFYFRVDVCRSLVEKSHADLGALLRSTRKNVVILQKRIVGLSEAALERFVLRARQGAGLKAPVDVLVTNSAQVRLFNRRFRGKNKATDVLSFPSISTSGNPVKLAGDIAISGDIAVRNAARLGHSAAEEIKILTLHGILHLAGFDHERDNGTMARKEIRLRQKLKLPLGLIERTKSTSSKPTSKKHASQTIPKARSIRLRRTV